MGPREIYTRAEGRPGARRPDPAGAGRPRLPLNLAKAKATASRCVVFFFFSLPQNQVGSWT